MVRRATISWYVSSEATALGNKLQINDTARISYISLPRVFGSIVHITHTPVRILEGYSRLVGLLRDPNFLDRQDTRAVYNKAFASFLTHSFSEDIRFLFQNRESLCSSQRQYPSISRSSSARISLSPDWGDMAPLLPPLARSESKIRLLERVGLDIRNPHHRHVYDLMKVSLRLIRCRNAS